MTGMADARTGGGRVPWLVSMAMWVHCMRLVPQDGIPAGELFRRGHLSAKTVKQLQARRVAGASPAAQDAAPLSGGLAPRGVP
jgi:hypothetical protein